MTNEWKPELSQEVTEGINAAIHAERDLNQIDAAIAATNNELATAKSTMDTAREALAGAEAKAALEGGGADNPRALLVARDDHEFLAARLERLQARRKAALDTLARARHGAAVSYRTWQRQQAQHFVENVYNPVMDAFLAVIRMAVGASAALDSHMLTAIGRDTVLRDPSNWDKKPRERAAYRLAVRPAVLAPLGTGGARAPAPWQGLDRAAAGGQRCRRVACRRICSHRPIRCMAVACWTRWSSVACAGAGGPGVFPRGWCRPVASRTKWLAMNGYAGMDRQMEAALGREPS